MGPSEANGVSEGSEDTRRSRWATYGYGAGALQANVSPCGKKAEDDGQSNKGFVGHHEMFSMAFAVLFSGVESEQARRAGRK